MALQKLFLKNKEKSLTCLSEESTFVNKQVRTMDVSKLTIVLKALSHGAFFCLRL